MNMKDKNVLDLIVAFAVVLLVIGIIITALAKDTTTASDAGKIMVISGAIVAAVCQIIARFKGKR